MSEDGDSWIQNALGVDVSQTLQNVKDDASAAIGQVADTAAAVAQPVAAAIDTAAAVAQPVAAVIDTATAVAQPVTAVIDTAATDSGGSSGVLASVASATSSLGSTVSSAASTALDWGNTAGKAVADTESAAWDATKSAYNATTSAYDSVAPDFTKSNKDLGSLVDQGEALAKKGNAEAVAQAPDGILGSLEKASAAFSNATIDATGGVIKGAGDLTAMAGNAIFHPIDAAEGMAEGALGIAEHVPFVPGMNTTVKAIHGAVDLARGKQDGVYGSSVGDLAQNLLMDTQQDPDDPSKRSNTDVDFLASMGGGKKAWEDKPFEAATRTLTNLAPMLLGDGAAEPVPEEIPPPEAAGPKVINPNGEPVQINPTHPLYPDAGAPTVRAPDLSPPSGATPDLPPGATPDLPPDTIPERPQFPAPPGDPLPPDPIPKLPGGPKEGPPIPREDPPSGPVDTARQPMDIPGLPQEEPLPSTKPRPPEDPNGPITQDAPPSQGSAVPTERGLGGIPAIPRGMDPGALIQLVIDTPGGKSVVELMQELGMPVEKR